MKASRRLVSLVATALAGIVLVLAAAAVALVAAGRFGALRGAPPPELGVRDGLLKPPSATANSVHSQAARFAGHPQAEGARIAPLPARGDGPATMARLRTLIESTPGARIVEIRADYLRVEYTTRWLAFVDDAEFWFDPAERVVQLRSASRLGRRDFGANRARIDALRARWAAGG